jgi:hypothetical protein
VLLTLVRSGAVAVPPLSFAIRPLTAVLTPSDVRPQPLLNAIVTVAAAKVRNVAPVAPFTTKFDRRSRVSIQGSLTKSLLSAQDRRAGQFTDNRVSMRAGPIRIEIVRA